MIDYKDIPEAKWYESSTGYIGYHSNIFPGLICRVYEAVLSVEDAHENRKDAWQYAMLDEKSLDHNAVLAQESELLDEALGVTNKRRAVVLGLLAMERESEKPGDGTKAMATQTQRIRLWRSFGMTERKFRRATRIK